MQWITQATQFAVGVRATGIYVRTWRNRDTVGYLIVIKIPSEITECPPPPLINFISFDVINVGV